MSRRAGTQRTCVLGAFWATPSSLPDRWSPHTPDCGRVIPRTASGYISRGLEPGTWGTGSGTGTPSEFPAGCRSAGRVAELGGTRRFPEPGRFAPSMKIGFASAFPRRRRRTAWVLGLILEDHNLWAWPRRIRCARAFDMERRGAPFQKCPDGSRTLRSAVGTSKPDPRSCAERSGTDSSDAGQGCDLGPQLPVSHSGQQSGFAVVRKFAHPPGITFGLGQMAWPIASKRTRRILHHPALRCELQERRR